VLRLREGGISQRGLLRASRAVAIDVFVMIGPWGRLLLHRDDST